MTNLDGRQAFQRVKNLDALFPQPENAEPPAFIRFLYAGNLRMTLSAGFRTGIKTAILQGEGRR
jgi:hypothetical protein